MAVPTFSIRDQDLRAWREASSGGLVSQLLDAVEDMVFVKDLEGSFVYNNAAHLAFLRRSRDDVEGRTDFELFSAEEAEEFFANDTRLLETERPVVSVHAARDENEVPVVDVAIKHVVRQTDGSVAGLVGVVKRFATVDDSRRADLIRRVITAVKRALGDDVESSQLLALEHAVKGLLE